MATSETRASLLLRIRDPNDRESWNEFAKIYRPAIIRTAKVRGLQNADAEDLAQQVLISVANSIKHWKQDPQSNKRATFRTWLYQVTRNAVINALTRRAPDAASGNSKVNEMLNQRPVSVGDNSSQLTIEIRRETFRYAANQIREDFQSGTWQAFWLTAVDGHSIETAAEELNKSHGAIYAARSRVMKRLKEMVQQIQIIESEDSNED